MFSRIPLPKNRAERIYYPVNDNEEMIVDIEKDAEQPIVLCHLYMKRDATPDDQKNNEAYLRADYIDELLSWLINGRLSELKQQPVPPFQSATGRASGFFVSRTKDAFSLSVGCKQESILGGLMTAVAACEQMRQQGFTQSEFERAKKFRLNHDERKFNERHDRSNSKLVSLCVQNFLSGEPLISIEDKWQLTQKFDREVTLDEVNRALRELITDQNQVLVMYAPDKETVALPSEQQLKDVVLATQKQQYAAYDDGAATGELGDCRELKDLKPGRIVSEKAWKHGFTELVLSNGMKVYVRQTDFNKNTVQLTMRADGGTSCYGNEDIPNFSLISSSISEAGVASWDATQLRKVMTGKSVRVQPSVGSRSQSISGGASVKDAEAMMQLAHLYFAHPRRDTAAFAGLVNRSHSFLNNRNASPRVDYNDSITAILYGHHPRLEPMTQERLLKADYDRIFQIYKERFSNAADFKTVIIGNMSLDELRPLIVKYLATLPATDKHETTRWQNVPQLVKQDVTKVFKKKMATPLANVSIFYGAEIEFTPKNDLALDFLKRCLSIAYTDSVREEKGGTYGVSVNFEFDKDDKPAATIRISYNADPSRYEELNPIIYQQLKNIAEKGPEATSMQKVSEYLIKQYGQAAITNDYWNYIIWHELDDDADFDKDYCEMCRQMTAKDVQQVARKLLDGGYRIEVTMLSE
jgi:zinc protease